MRRLQGDICVYPKNGKPKSTSEDEELVQISGNYGATDVLDIASRLTVRTLHDENAGVEPKRARPILGFGLAHNLLGIDPPPSFMMGASNSGGCEPLKFGVLELGNNTPLSSAASLGYALCLCNVDETQIPRYEPCFGGQHYSHNGGCDV